MIETSQTSPPMLLKHEFRISFARNALWAKVTGCFTGIKQKLDELEFKTYRESEDGIWVLVGALAAVLDKEYICKIKESIDEKKLTDAAEELVLSDCLRGYQAEAALAALLAGFGRSIIDLTMGAGKTRLSAGIVALGSFCEAKRWLYLVHNKELASQSCNEFAECLPKMLDVLEVEHNRPHLLARTYSQLNSLDPNECDGVIVDECHALVPPTRSLAYARIRSFWKIGLSGTALDRQDGRNALTVGLLGPVVYKADIADLEDEGYLAPGLVVPVYYGEPA